MIVKHLRLSKYHWCVLAFYVLLTPFLFTFATKRLSYGFNYEHLGLAVTVIVCSLFYLLAFLFLKRTKELSLRLPYVASVIAYGTLFAFPEEIIFRGIIQGFLQNHFANVTFAILFSSLVFGIAHVLNAAESIHPKDWNWKLAVLAVLAGIPLGLVFAITNSLLIPTFLHAFLVICSKLLTEDTVF